MGSANTLHPKVSTKVLQSLGAFSSDEQSRFKESSPTSKISPLEAEAHPAKIKYEVVAISAAPPGNREELVAYVEGPTVYFIVVMTADSHAAIERHRDTFMSYLRGFTPMDRK